MENRLNCTICYECYDSERRRPRVLKCGHTLCTTCTNCLLRKPSKICPTCREPFQAENIEDVAINYAIDGFLDTSIQEKFAGYLETLHRFPRTTSMDETSPCSLWGSSYTARQNRQMSSPPCSSFGSPGSHFSSNQTEMPFGNGSRNFIPGYMVSVEDTSPTAPTLYDPDVTDEEVLDVVQDPRQGRRKKCIAGKIARGALRGLLFLMD